MAHHEDISGYEQDLTTLTQYITRLRPDVQNRFYELLGHKLSVDSKMDSRRGRVQLADGLSFISEKIFEMENQYHPLLFLENRDFPSELPSHPSLNNLVSEITTLQYNRMTAFFSCLRDAYLEGVSNKFGRSRPLLQEMYNNTQSLLLPVVATSEEVWKICKPYELNNVRWEQSS